MKQLPRRFTVVTALYWKNKQIEVPKGITLLTENQVDATCVNASAWENKTTPQK